jgi:uncharacterized protein with FMN-binding domain
MKKKHKVLIIIASVLVVLVAAGVIAFSVISGNLQTLSRMEIKNVDLASIPDGTYNGSYDQFPVGAEVNVTVKGHVITDIALVRHSHGPGHGADAITGEVVKAQSLQVDAVSGATMSSKAVLKAIENALAGGKG